MLMKAQQIRHIVWDWNGTLLDDTSACVAALNRMLEKRRLPPVDIRQYQETFGFPVKDYYLTLGFDFARDNWDDVAREYHDFYAITSASVPLRAGAVELLQRLRDRGMPMSILSACELSILEQMLAARGIRSFFEQVRGLSNLFATSKVGIGRALLADIHLPADQVLLIGDTLHDHEVAQELGCKCLLVNGGHQAEHRLAGCACDIVSDLHDVFA